MPGAGLGMFAAHMRNRKPTGKCERCGLYFPKSEENCIHCHDLSDSELIKFKEKISKEHKGNASLGKLMLFTGAVVFLLVVLVNI